MTMSKYTQPQIGTSALVTVDVQNDFTLRGAPAEIEGTEEAVPQMVRSLEAFRAKGLPIFHMVRL
ncbi:MAG: cysteine hydrolase, partial [Proteobacteria bacterium SW_6_67_9]